MQNNNLNARISNIFNLSTVKKSFKYTNDFFNVLQPVIEKPTLWNGIKAAVMLGKVIVDDMEIWPEIYFDEGWIQPYGFEFNEIVLKVLEKFPCTTLKTAEDYRVIKIINLNGIKVGWLHNTRLNFGDAVHVDSSRVEEAKEIISKLLWERFKDKPIVLHKKSSKKPGGMENPISFDIDDSFNPLPCEYSRNYSEYLKKCIDANVARSVMFYGSPGTGKSTMTRAIVDSLHLRSFRIRIEDIGDIDSATLFEAVNIFKPEAVIFDDFDRVSEQVSLLETLEFFQRHVKLILATVNDRSKLDRALLRPGRFDEFVHVKKMDEEVVRHILGEYGDAFETVKDWPIAYISEYVKRRKFLTPEETIRSIDELTKRMTSLKESYDDEVFIPKVNSHRKNK